MIIRHAKTAEFKPQKNADVMRFYTGTSRFNTAVPFCTLAFTSKET